MRSDSTVYAYSISFGFFYATFRLDGRAGSLAPIVVARLATGPGGHALPGHGLCRAVGAAAWRRLARWLPDRLAAAASWVWRVAPAGASLGAAGWFAHRAVTAAPSAAGTGPGGAGTGAIATAVAAQCRQQGCFMGGRKYPAQWQLWRAAVLAAACARRQPAPLAPGGAGRQYPVLHAAPAAWRTGCVAGAAAPVLAAGVRRHRDRLYQTPGTAARCAAVPALATSFFTAAPCVSGSAFACLGSRSKSFARTGRLTRLAWCWSRSKSWPCRRWPARRGSSQACGAVAC